MPAPGANTQASAAQVQPYNNAPGVGNLPVKDLIMDVTYNNITASFNETNIFDCLNYRYLEVSIITTVNSGSGITLQVDLNNCLDAAGAVQIDYFNDGAKPVPGNNTHMYGPNVTNNTVIPRWLRLGYIIAGTTPNINMRVVVRGYL